MNTPTQEQIEAALRWENNEWTKDDESLFLDYDCHAKYEQTVESILAAAYRETRRQRDEWSNLCARHRRDKIELKEQRDVLAKALKEIITEEEFHDRMDRLTGATAKNALASYQDQQWMIDDATQRDAMAKACKMLMDVVGPPGSSAWAKVEDIDAAYIAGEKALAAMKGGIR